MAIDNQSIALRAQDFHEALKETTSFGPKDVHFEKTLLVGKAASLAMHLKGLLYIDEMDGLKYAAAELGISGLELRPVLRQLEIVDFVRLKTSGDEIKRIDVRVPEFRSGYEDLGVLWKDSKPSEIEKSGVAVLQTLLSKPMKESGLKDLGLDNTAQSILYDVMGSGQLLRIQPVDGQRVLYSPLAVDANPGPYLQWTEKYSDRVSGLLKSLTSHQGIPLSSETFTGNEVVQDAILTGVLMPVRVQGTTGEQQFLFAPKGGLKAEERVILDKARAIIASVRYGQNFAAGRPIQYPRAILKQLRDNKRFRKGHPDLSSQYSLLVEKLIGRPVKEDNGFWNFYINDTEENLMALDVAIDMVEYGESPNLRLKLAAKNALLSPRGYLGPASARPRLATAITGSPETRAEILKKLGELGRGIVDV